MKSVIPSLPGNLTSAKAITPADAEPDVTWGRGGIDDWGWTTVERADEPVNQAGGGE